MSVCACLCVCMCVCVCVCVRERVCALVRRDTIGSINQPGVYLFLCSSEVTSKFGPSCLLKLPTSAPLPGKAPLVIRIVITHGCP